MLTVEGLRRIMDSEYGLRERADCLGGDLDCVANAEDVENFREELAGAIQNAERQCETLLAGATL